MNPDNNQLPNNQDQSTDWIPFSEPPLEIPESITEKLSRHPMHLLDEEQNQLARECRQLIEQLYQENWHR
jgi:hypothetical protein